MSYILLIIGIFLLLKGADIFVEGAASLALKLKLSSLMVGLTVVSFGTSAPEAAIGISAALSGSDRIALGNVIGSNLFNLLMVIGATAMLAPLDVNGYAVRRDLPINLIAAGMLTVMMLDGVIGRGEACLLLAALAAYMLVLAKSASRISVSAAERREHPWHICVIMIGCGLISILVGGELVVDNAGLIAASLGMDELLIGLTVVALGTSLPELVTSLAALRRGEADMAFGNAIGSSLFNILFILGTTGAIKPIAVGAESMADAACLIVASAVIYCLAARKKRLGRAEGILCIILYVAYMLFVIWRAYAPLGAA